MYLFPRLTGKGRPWNICRGKHLSLPNINWICWAGTSGLFKSPTGHEARPGQQVPARGRIWPHWLSRDNSTNLLPAWEAIQDLKYLQRGTLSSTQSQQPVLSPVSLGSLLKASSDQKANAGQKLSAKQSTWSVPPQQPLHKVSVPHLRLFQTRKQV